MQSFFGSNGICVDLMKSSECWIELNSFDLMFDCRTASKIRLNFFQLCFKDVGGIGAASEVILTTRSRVVSDPQEESLLMWLVEVKEAKASCQRKGCRHVDKGPLPVYRNSWEILGKGPLSWAENKVANNGEDEQSRIPQNYFWNIFPTSQCFVEREEGEDGA